MSFAFTKVGTAATVAGEINQLKIEDNFGREVRDVLVRQLGSYQADPTVIVKVSGYTDTYHMSLNVNVETVY